MIIVAIVFGLLLGSPLLIPTCLIGMIIGEILRRVLQSVPGVGPVPDAPETAPTHRGLVGWRWQPARCGGRRAGTGRGLKFERHIPAVGAHARMGLLLGFR